MGAILEETLTWSAPGLSVESLFLREGIPSTVALIVKIPVLMRLRQENLKLPASLSNFRKTLSQKENFFWDKI